MKKLFLINLFFCFSNLFLNAQTTTNMNLPASGITCIVKDYNNNIWVGTTSQGLWKRDAVTLTWSSCPPLVSQSSFTGSINFNTININDIAADANGGVWIAHAGQAGSAATLGGVDYLPNGFSTLYHFNDLMGSFSLPSSNVSTLDIDQNGTIWAGCGVTYSGTYKAGGLAYKKTRNSSFTNTGFTDISQSLPHGEYYTASTGDSRQVISINCRSSTEIWVGRSGSAYNANPFINSQIVRYDTSGSNVGSYIWQNYPVLPFSQKIVPSTLYTDANGNGWCGIYNYNFNSYGGFCVFKNGVWSYIDNASMPTVFPANAQVNANAIWGDDLGQVFIGTTKGLIIYDGVGLPTAPASYTRFNCISNNLNIIGGCVDNDGDVWLATPTSIVKFEGAEVLSVLGVYNINPEDATPTYDSRRLLPRGLEYCVNSTNPIIKVAADSSEATLFKILSPKIRGHKIRIKNFNNTEPDKYGKVRHLTSNSADNLTAIYKHPSYKDATTPTYVEFEVYDTLSAEVDMLFKVEIKPTPVLFVHGLWSDGSAFSIMKNHFINNGYDAYEVYAPSYPNHKSFTENAPMIPIFIDELKNFCFASNLSSGKVNVVTHSMGGILTRLYLQNSAGLYYRKDINKFITINTPHSGSQAANLLINSSVCYKNSTTVASSCIGLVNLIALKEGGWNNYQAIIDLQVNSPATRDILNGSAYLANQNIVPTHLIVSQKDLPAVPVAAILGLCKARMCVAAKLFYRLLCGNQNMNDCIRNNLYGGEFNDWIVALSSQRGGLSVGSSQYTSFNSLNHMEITDDLSVCSEIKNLLSYKNDNPKFNLTGFYPPTLPPPIRDERGQNQSQAKMVTTIELSATTTGIVQTGSVINLTVTGSSDINTLVTMSGNDTLDIESNYYSSNTVTFQYTVPQNASGKIKFAVIGFGTTNVFDTLSIQLGSAIVLPITLSQFNGKTMDNTNYLQWQTVTEINTQYFEVERSADAQNWFRLGKVKAAGNSQTTQNYAFLDEKPASKNYYRLKSVDNDGKSSFSSVIYLSNSKEYELEVFPVPSKQQVTIRYNTSESETAKVTIYDVVGKLCYTTDIAVDNTSSDYLIDISRLSKGVYFLNFTVNGRNLVSKIIQE